MIFTQKHGVIILSSCSDDPRRSALVKFLVEQSKRPTTEQGESVLTEPLEVVEQTAEVGFLQRSRWRPSNKRRR